jgi:hypothetical protein
MAIKTTSGPQRKHDDAAFSPDTNNKLTGAPLNYSPTAALNTWKRLHLTF